MFCEKCGKELKEGWSVCPYCGAVKSVDIKETQTQQKKHSKIIKKMIPYIIGGICVLMLGKLFMGEGNDDASEAHNKTNGSEHEMAVKEEEQYTIQDYLNNCTVVTNDQIARNAQSYIGSDIIIEGRFTVMFDNVYINFWESGSSITVKYDGTAYDSNARPLGKILNGDEGYVAGRLTSEDTLEAVIVVITKEQ